MGSECAVSVSPGVLPALRERLGPGRVPRKVDLIWECHDVWLEQARHSSLSVSPLHQLWHLLRNFLYALRNLASREAAAPLYQEPPYLTIQRPLKSPSVRRFPHSRQHLIALRNILHQSRTEGQFELGLAESHFQMSILHRKDFFSEAADDSCSSQAPPCSHRRPRLQRATLGPMARGWLLVVVVTGSSHRERALRASSVQ